jgi:hypothetical protein
MGAVEIRPGDREIAELNFYSVGIRATIKKMNRAHLLEWLLNVGSQKIE